MIDYPTLRIAHLYPSLLNVAGDGGNVMALVQRCAWRGIPTEVVTVEQGDSPDFTTFDLILFHGGQDVEQQVVAKDLWLKVPSLAEAADQGVVIFAVCAGLQLLGHRYVPSVGEPMEGAAILDLETHAGSQRFMQHAAVEVTLNGETGTVVGFENHSGLTTLGPDARPFSYPYGSYNNYAVAACIDAGFVHGFTTHRAWVELCADPHRLPRFDTTDVNAVLREKLTCQQV